MLRDITGKDGFKHQYWLPDDQPQLEPQHGLEMSLDFAELADQFGMPRDFARKLQGELWKRGIITPKDYFKDDIHAIVGQALRQVLKVESNEIIDYIRRNNNAN